MYSIRKITHAELEVIRKMISVIYPATYGQILSQDQIDFMLDKSYSVVGLSESMASGQDFYVIYQDADGTALGFIALQNKAHHLLRIEKLYLMPEEQGKGLGKRLVDFASAECLRRDRTILELNVNRNNTAYYFYLKLGFQVVEKVDIPYYGFVLNDYVMQKQAETEGSELVK